METEIYRKKYRFLIVSAFSAFIGTLDASIVNVSLPTLSRTFSVSVDVVAWVVLAYSLAVTSTLLLVGRMASKNGYRYVYLAGFILFGTGSLLCALAGSIWHLIGSRIIQGVGASFLMASGPALISRAFPASERGKALGLLGTVVGIGLMTGPPLGGFLVTAVGWHSIFLINIPVAIFGFIYVSRLLKVIPPDDPDIKIDYWGGLFQATGVICFLLFLNRINSPDWSPGALYSVLAVGVVTLAAFLWRESHTDQPLLGFSIFGYRQFTIAFSVMVIAFICTSAGMVLIPFYLEEILGLLPSQVGLVLMTIPICTALAAPTSGRISDAIGYRLLTTIGLVFLFGGMLWVSTLDQQASRFDVVLRLLIVGIGLGIYQSPNLSAMMSAVPARVLGVASGLAAVGRNIGITTGVAVSTAVFSYRRVLYAQKLPSEEAFIQSFSGVVTAFAVLVLAAVIISFFRYNRPSAHG